MSTFDVRLIIDRMKSVESVRNDKELADRIGVEAGVLSKWKTRNSIPFERAVEFANNKRISIDWLVFGEKNEKLSTDEQMFLTAYRQLDQEQKVKLMMQMSGLGNSTNGVSFTANGNDNNQQILHGNVGEVTGIKKK